MHIITKNLNDSSCLRFSGAGCGVRVSHWSLCGCAAGGPGEGFILNRPPGRPLPQFGQQGHCLTAGSQHWYGSQTVSQSVRLWLELCTASVCAVVMWIQNYDVNIYSMGASFMPLCCPRQWSDTDPGWKLYQYVWCPFKIYAHFVPEWEKLYSKYRNS